MAKKDEFGDGKTVPVKADDKNFNAAIETITSTLLNPDLNGKNREELINTLKAVLDKFGSQKFNASVENLRTALANLGLKIIDDINAKRVHKPEEVYNALVSIYNAIK